MGHYTGIHIHLTFKKDTPEAVIDIVRQMAGDADNNENMPVPADTLMHGLIPSSDAVRQMLADVEYCMHGGLSLVEDEQGRWVFNSKVSRKHTHRESTANFLISMLPYLDVVEGDILYRDLYEEGIQEKIFYVTEGSIRFSDEGYWYYCLYDDGEHPRRLDVGDGWNPPMNLEPMRSSVADKKSKATSRLDDSRYGW